MKAQKTYSTSGIILFLLSMVYLCAELVFNRQLLDVSSSVRSDPDQVEHIQYFGRAASGLGFTLLVQGIFQQFGFQDYQPETMDDFCRYYPAFASCRLS